MNNHSDVEESRQVEIENLSKPDGLMEYLEMKQAEARAEGKKITNLRTLSEVYVMIESFEQMEDRVCRAGTRAIAGQLGTLCFQTVARAIRRLQKFGLIEAVDETLEGLSPRAASSGRYRTLRPWEPSQNATPDEPESEQVSQDATEVLVNTDSYLEDTYRNQNLDSSIYISSSRDSYLIDSPSHSATRPAEPKNVPRTFILYWQCPSGCILASDQDSKFKCQHGHDIRAGHDFRLALDGGMSRAMPHDEAIKFLEKVIPNGSQIQFA